MLSTRLIDDLLEAEALAGPWDELAVESRRPFCSPAWMLAWWRCAALPRSSLRILTVFEGDQLIGIAPLFTSQDRSGVVRYGFLASGTAARLEPMARPGREEEVAARLADLLSNVCGPTPHLLTLSEVAMESPWAALLTDAWPAARRPWLHRSVTMPAPFLSLVGRTYQEWFAELPRRFRSELRRRWRRLEEKGADLSLVEDQEVTGLLPDFVRLHHGRWAPRGGSGALDAGIQRMLPEVARDLAGTGRFRLWTMKVGDEVISAQLFLGAGGNLSYWLGGFDETWGSYGLTFQGLRAAIEHAWTVGDHRIDFGAGGQDYKYRFAEEEEAVGSQMIVPRTSRYPLTRLLLAPGQIGESTTRIRHHAFRRLSPRAQQRVKAVLKRVRTARRS